VFVTTHTADDKLWLIKIDSKSGEVLWTREVGSGMGEYEGPKRQPRKEHRFYSPAGPTPATNGEIVVVHFGNGDLAAYDFAGERLWKRNLQDDYGAYTSWYGHANSPVIFDDLVISVCMQDPIADLRQPRIDSYLVAHDLKSGDVRWRVTRNTKADAEQGDAYTTPLLCTLGGVRQLVVMGGNQLDAYDPVTGRQLWFLPGLMGGRTVTGPTVAGDMIIATRGLRGAMFAVAPYRRRAETRGAGQPVGDEGERPRELTHRDLVWTYGEGSPDSCSPVVWNELLFAVTDDGIARCFDVASGNLKWKERLKGQYKASPVAVDGRVFFLNIEGLCTVISAAPRFDNLAENKLEDTTLGSLAINEGTIFVRGNRWLYCVGK
jgi:outer membrane protein assembly factor BamB